VDRDEALMTRLPDERVRVAVLGLGNAGQGAIAHILDSKVVELVGVCDVDTDVTDRAASDHGVRAFRSVQELASSEDVEAVYVATPTFLHLEHAMELARLGKHLMIEKPVTRSTDEAQALVALGESTGVTIMSVNTRGGDAPIRALAKAVAAGTIGDVLSVVTISYTDWTLKPRRRYELLAELGGGVIFRQAPHQVETVRALAQGRVVAVTAGQGAALEPVETTASYNALLQFDSGASATLVYNGLGFFNTAELTYGLGKTGKPVVPDASASRRQAKSWELDKYGADAVRLKSESRGSAKPFSDGRGFSGFTIVSGTRGDLRQSPGGITAYTEVGVREEAFAVDDGGLPVDFEDFAAALRAGDPLLHDAAWGAATVAVCDAIWRSATERRLIEL
jgi:phthalate 4,5-cis-dihydrodiol dehydrogenase